MEHADHRRSQCTFYRENPEEQRKRHYQECGLFFGNEDELRLQRLGNPSTSLRVPSPRKSRRSKRKLAWPRSGSKSPIIQSFLQPLGGMASTLSMRRPSKSTNSPEPRYRKPSPSDLWPTVAANRAPIIGVGRGPAAASPRTGKGACISTSRGGGGLRHITLSTLILRVRAILSQRAYQRIAKSKQCQIAGTVHAREGPK
jgi:hypothetical protein